LRGAGGQLEDYNTGKILGYNLMKDSLLNSHFIARS